MSHQNSSFVGTPWPFSKVLLRENLKIHGAEKGESREMENDYISKCLF
jgi:hypothetical protein